MTKPASLKRELGMSGAIVTGLGSILGTGAFVAIGLASSSWGDLVLWAIPLAALVATFNGLSSAYLAGRFPVAGGTYEYAYRALSPLWGFTAGWLFLLAKTASAAAAALGLALYLGHEGNVGLALGAVTLVTLLVGNGLKRTTAVNVALLIGTLAGIIAFALGGFADTTGSFNVGPLGDGTKGGLLAAIAFLFVAYTGYGRIATLGEEVRRPARTIPVAVIVTLVITAVLYMGFGLGGRAVGGAYWGALIDTGISPADLVSAPYATVIEIGAATAMVGVLLNLILGLSRVWLAMGRRQDMPERLSWLDGRSNPTRAVGMAGVAVGAATLMGDIGLAWSFSAMTVLLYYGITNLAVLRLDRRRPTAWAGLVSCVFLSFFVPPSVWLTGGGLVLAGLVWKTVLDRRSWVP